MGTSEDILPNDSIGEIGDEAYCITNNNNDNHDNDGSSILIDNTSLVYVPIQLPRSGVVCMFRIEIIQQQSLLQFIMDMIDDDVCCCFHLLPASVHSLILRTKLWINHYYIYGNQYKPYIVKHTTTHHCIDYLLITKDNIDKCYGIEFYNINEYCYHTRYHWNGYGGLLLHEYCHLIHQFVLQLNNLYIQQLYIHTKQLKKYYKVLRRDWFMDSRHKYLTTNKNSITDGGNNIHDTSDSHNPLTDHFDLAYAMVNEKEFFAEFSVTYLSRYYKELDSAPYDNIELTNPPYCIIPKRKNTIATTNDNNSISSCQQKEVVEGHCNKFYPFTSGQLKYYDLDLYNEFDNIWENIITLWNDTNGDNTTIQSSHQTIQSIQPSLLTKSIVRSTGQNHREQVNRKQHSQSNDEVGTFTKHIKSNNSNYNNKDKDYLNDDCDNDYKKDLYQTICQNDESSCCCRDTKHGMVCSISCPILSWITTKSKKDNEATFVMLNNDNSFCNSDDHHIIVNKMDDNDPVLSGPQQQKQLQQSLTHMKSIPDTVDL